MRIEDFGGVSHARNKAELEAVLARRFGTGVNEFWLFGDGADGPRLSIVVKGDLASLTYFPGGDHPGYTSVGGVEGLDPEGFSTFYVNTPREKHEVANDSLVPVDDATRAAIEFMESPVLPNALDWLEL